MRTLFWFRNDLRLSDNIALNAALEAGPTLAVYILDKKELLNSNLGFKKTGVFRLKFLLESLENLKENLKAKGGDLVFKIGNPEEEVFELCKIHDIELVIATKAVTQDETSNETELSSKLKTLNIDLRLIWQNTLVNVKDLPFGVRFLPDIFTTFRQKLEANLKINEPETFYLNSVFIGAKDNLALPTLEELGYNSTQPHKYSLNLLGGETAALEHLKYYFWDTQNIKTYKETRNGFSGLGYSSKLSFYLSNGCISARQVYAEIIKFEKEVVKNDSTYWLFFELLWRDYFCFVALKYGIRLFKRSGIKHDIYKTWKKNKTEFKKWMDGKTGHSLVDACMKDLKATGFLSNRGRQIVASYLCHNLNIEWWWGASYFESVLIDYDVCSNWGNWNYIAGIGNDPRENRMFNPDLQAEKYDKNGEYQKMWLEE